MWVSTVGKRFRATWREGQWVVVDTHLDEIVAKHGNMPDVSAVNARNDAKARNGQG